VPVEPHLRRPRRIRADLDEPRTELRVQDVEVIGADTTLLAEEVKARDPRLAGAVAGREHPLELLAGNDRDHPKAAVSLSPLQMRADVIELAVIPPRPIRLLQRQDRDPVLLSELLDVPAETVPDPPEQRRRWNLVAQVPALEAHDLPADLQVRDVRVQVQPIDTLDLERHMTLEHVVDVRLARHPRSMDQIGPALPDRRPAPRGGRPGGGPDPLPLKGP
jgi:hypothetical protein